jgi:hypothetical protein
MRIVPHACKRPLAAVSIAALALLALGTSPSLATAKAAPQKPSAQKPADKPPKPDLTVMTRNLYIGANILVVAGAVDPADFLAKAREFILGVAATNFPERADALAAEIADKKPDVVGMQEVYDFTLGPDYQHGPVPFVNYLDVLLAALEKRGMHYKVVATVEDANILAPVDVDGNGSVELIRVVDHDVILVRDGIDAWPVPLKDLYPQCRASLDGCNYNVVLRATLPVGSVDFERGFVAAIVAKDGQTYFVFNTHLEVRTPAPDNPYSAFYQAAQAFELKSVLDNWPAGAKVIVTGDFNSSPEDAPLPVPEDLQALGLPPVIYPPYMQFTFGPKGFYDAWTLRPGKPPGLSCCQDADLLNPWSVLHERIDLVFSREEPTDVKANQVGNSPEDKTPSGFWPSDHSGLVVRYSF